jgi:hypothetical protein
VNRDNIDYGDYIDKDNIDFKYNTKSAKLTSYRCYIILPVKQDHVLRILLVMLLLNFGLDVLMLPFQAMFEKVQVKNQSIL